MTIQELKNFCTEKGICALGDRRRKLTWSDAVKFYSDNLTPPSLSPALPEESTVEPETIANIELEPFRYPVKQTFPCFLAYIYYLVMVLLGKRTYQWHR